MNSPGEESEKVNGLPMVTYKHHAGSCARRKHSIIIPLPPPAPPAPPKLEFCVLLHLLKVVLSDAAVNAQVIPSGAAVRWVHPGKHRSRLGKGAGSTPSCCAAPDDLVTLIIQVPYTELEALLTSPFELDPKYLAVARPRRLEVGVAQHEPLFIWVALLSNVDFSFVSFPVKLMVHLFVLSSSSAAWTIGSPRWKLLPLQFRWLGLASVEGFFYGCI